MATRTMHHLVQFSDEEWAFYYRICNEYSIGELKTTYLHKSKRNQTDKNTMVIQSTTGKIAEWAVTLYFTDLPCKISDPDMTLYAEDCKTFEPDLTLDGHDLNVKSQHVSSAARFGTSWMFQYNGNGVGHCDSLIKDDKGGLVAFCIVDFDNKQVDLVGVCDFNAIRHKLREPKKECLKNSKRCIYMDDLDASDFIDISYNRT